MPDAEKTPRHAGLAPGGTLAGELRPPGSKSIAQRALLAAWAAGGTTRLAGLPDGDDVVACRGLVAGLGARLTDEGDTLRIECPGGAAGALSLALGESGTLARLATALVAFRRPAGSRTELRPTGSLATRSSEPLVRALEEAGVGLEARVASGGRGWPLTVRASAAPRRVVLRDPSSSQEASALLLALAPGAAGEPARWLEVEGEIPSRPYLELTRGLLASFGVRVEEERIDGRSRFTWSGALAAPAAPYVIEPDASAAAVALAAACLGGGGVRVPGLGRGSLQGDVRIVEHLAAFGCGARFDGDALVASGAPRKGARLDLSGEPDLAPVLAAVAARAAELGHGSELRGLETLPGKESDRLAVLAQGLGRAGYRVRTTDRSLEISPGAEDTGALVVDPRGDHRMAFAFALLGLFREGVSVADPGCVAKSWPGFWDAIGAAGARRRA